MQDLFFSVKLLGVMSKVIMFLSTELVGQCRNILPLAISAFTSVGQLIRKRPRAIYSCTDRLTQLIRVYYCRWHFTLFSARGGGGGGGEGSVLVDAPETKLELLD